MVGSGSKTWVEVSRSALRSNAAALKKAVGRGVKLIAVVKSNAYGHGLPETVKAVGSQADWFAVDSTVEAEAVRRAGSNKPVLVLGYTPDWLLAGAVRRGFSFVAYNFGTFRALARVASARYPAKVHLKMETGTSRQGILYKDLPGILKLIARYPQIRVEGVSTHYANIEDTTDPAYAMRQLKRFNESLDQVRSAGFRPEIVHTACSAAAILYPQTRFSGVRTGIALYGLWPSESTRQSAAGSGLKLRPALAWKTVVAQVKRLPKGTPISYGLTERLRRDSTVAVLPVGYWDGFDRGFSSVGQVLIGGRRAKVLGRVCMNMCVVDAIGIPNVRPGQEAVLIGRQRGASVTAEEAADRLGTINYEVVTRINPLIPRVLVK